MSNPIHTKRLLGVWRRKPCRKVLAVRAPPPVDVYWENLAHNSSLLQIFFIFLTCLFACAVGGILFVAQDQQVIRLSFLEIGPQWVRPGSSDLLHHLHIRQNRRDVAEGIHCLRTTSFLDTSADLLRLQARYFQLFIRYLPASLRVPRPSYFFSRSAQRDRPCSPSLRLPRPSCLFLQFCLPLQTATVLLSEAQDQERPAYLLHPQRSPESCFQRHIPLCEKIR